MHYFLRLNPCRPTFAMDMTPTERAHMGDHVVYWKSLMQSGKVVVFGPVMDPNGPFGVGIVEVDDEQEVRDIIAKDPAATINSYDYWPMNAILPNQHQ